MRQFRRQLEFPGLPRAPASPALRCHPRRTGGPSREARWRHSGRWIQTSLVVIQVNVLTLRSFKGASMVAKVSEKIVSVEILHLVNLADEVRAVVVAQQMINELAALLGNDPKLAELIEVACLFQHALDHLATVLIYRNWHIAAIAPTEDEAALRDDDRMAGNLWYWRARTTAVA